MQKTGGASVALHGGRVSDSVKSDSYNGYNSVFTDLSKDGYILRMIADAGSITIHPHAEAIFSNQYEARFVAFIGHEGPILMVVVATCPARDVLRHRFPYIKCSIHARARGTGGPVRLTVT